MPYLIPDWPCPSVVRAISSTRLNGCSAAPFDSLNLGAHVGDDIHAVHQNRAYLMQSTQMPAEPHWLTQVHGIECVELPTQLTQADASFTTLKRHVCVVMTADCLPVLFTNLRGDWVAAAHAGWRGLCDGVLEAVVKKYSGQPSEIMAWLGPAIGPLAFEVGVEVRAKFVAHNPLAAQAFQCQGNDKYLADLYLLAKQRLNALGIEQIYGGHFCTYTDRERFFSYRRDHHTGRQASFIWIEGDGPSC